MQTKPNGLTRGFPNSTVSVGKNGFRRYTDRISNEHSVSEMR